MHKKPKEVKILNISTIVVTPKAKITEVMIYGLGDDEMVYLWSPSNGGWILCTRDYIYF